MSDGLRYDIWLVSLPTRDRLATSIDNWPSPDRELVFVKATDADGRVGWGECSALNSAGYTSEWARGAFGMLTAGAEIDPVAHPMAFAGMEMAETDLKLRAGGESLASHLGARRSSVPAGATIGLGPVSETAAKAARLVDQGYRRIKLKISPGQILNGATAVRERFADIEIQLDANGSLGLNDLDDLAALSDLEIAVVEQPFLPDEKELTLRLRETLDVQVLADEAIRTVSDLKARSFYSGLVVKPGPVGGYAAVAELVNAARNLEWVLSVGGMLESGLGRHSLAAIAASDHFHIVGDVSPASQWLKHDPWPDLEMVDGQITTPSTPGVAPLPDTELLERFTVARGQALRH